MKLKLYNYLTKRKEVFKPLKAGKVGLYTCGPTVYDRSHIGNLRTYIFEDILRRALKASGYKVKQVMNITDVEDKIIKKMKAEKKTLGQITRPYEKLFFKDLKKINIEKAEKYPRATEHIKEMIDLIKQLIKKGYGYKAQDGSIYFKISKFKNYGKLSGLACQPARLTTANLAGWPKRVKDDEYAKEEASDFVLWKAAKAGEPTWNSPFGRGRPGWHIECSAMSMKYLGETFDIHSGAVDLIFPHHENEIAQSEAATGKKFAQFFVEGEHLLVNNRKMAKSLGNFLTLPNIENKGFDPLAFRYLVLSNHYRTKLNFSWEALESAEKALEKLRQQVTFVRPVGSELRPDRSENHERKFLEAVNDDLNIPKALAVLWQVIKDKNLSPDNKQILILRFDDILGLGLNRIKPLKIPLLIKKLVLKREKLRKEKKWQEADELRKKIRAMGWQIEDTEKGARLSKSEARNPKF